MLAVDWGRHRSGRRRRPGLQRLVLLRGLVVLLPGHGLLLGLFEELPYRGEASLLLLLQVLLSLGLVPGLNDRCVARDAVLQQLPLAFRIVSSVRDS